MLDLFLSIVILIYEDKSRSENPDNSFGRWYYEYICFKHQLVKRMMN